MWSTLGAPNTEVRCLVRFGARRFDCELSLTRTVNALSFELSRWVAESWQAVGAIFQSRADLASFALELAKKMKIRYVSPPMPVDLRMTQGIAPDVLAPDVPEREPTGEEGHRRGGGVSMDDSVIYNVAQMFGTDLPLRKEPKKHFVDDDGGDSD